MIKNKKILSVLLIIALFIVIINIPTITKAEYTADKEWSTIKPGDIIYFDKTGLDDWDKVQIHIWEDGGGNYKSWDDDDTMEKVDGTDNLYSFKVPSDMEANKYNMVIFKNGKSGDENQTINLGFIEAGFVYKVDNWDNGKRIGYWYLYDKSTIISHLENVKKYQEDKAYYTETSYGNLDELITKAATELTEIRLEAEKDINGNMTGKYYISIASTMNQIDDIVNNLVVNTEILKQKVDTEENNMNEYNEKYTPDSVKKLTDEINAANELLAKDNITIDEMKQAIASIDTAKTYLASKADKTKLEELLKSVNDLDKTVYTDDTVNNLLEVAKTSQEVYDDENATQAKVDDSVKELQEAIDALVKKSTTNNEENNNTQEDNYVQEEEKTQEESNKEENKNTENDTATPKTGDMSVIIYGSLLAIAVITFGATIVYNKRKSK